MIQAYVRLTRTEPRRSPAHMPAEIETLSSVNYDLAEADCKEPRPDWGIYHPVLTNRKIEQALKNAGAFPYVEGLNSDHVYSFGLAHQAEIKEIRPCPAGQS